MAADPKEVAIMRRFVKEVQQDGKLDLLKEFIHPQMKDHSGGPHAPNGLEGTKHALERFHQTIQDMTVTIEHSITSGGLVATNKVVQGKLMQDFIGVTAKGQAIRFRIMDWVKVVDGKFTDHWALLGPVEEL